MSKPTLTAIVPQLFVSDLGASCAFFTDKLGFTIDFLYGDPPFYGQVTRDGASLSLRHVDPPIRKGLTAAMQADADMLAASITVDDVKALHTEFQAAGAPFHQTLRTEPWGAETFIVRDPDGNLLLFAGGVS